MTHVIYWQFYKNDCERAYTYLVIWVLDKDPSLSANWEIPGSEFRQNYWSDLVISWGTIIARLCVILYFICEKKKLATTINDFRWILHGDHRLTIFSNFLLSCFLLLLVGPGLDRLFQQTIDPTVQYFLIGAVQTLLEWQSWSTNDSE